MRSVAGWAVLSAVSAPVLLIGGWTAAAARQPPGYDALTDTISALAGQAATDRWLMSAALGGLGLCHLATATGLRAAAPAGRLVLALGGAATILVAALPVPRAGGSTAHGVAAGTAFLALALWPALAARANRPRPALLSPPMAVAGSAALLAAVGWFALELSGGTRVGLSERIAAGAQSLWPLAVVLNARRQSADG
ncbi:MAG TPA: DUF998 domain-containing protein [Catenuloplanes sp.]|jgi:hypothetical membrane protein